MELGSPHLVLLFAGISGMNCNGSAVDMELSDDRAATEQLRLSLSARTAHFPQPQKADQNVLPGIFVRQKSFPPLVCSVVPAEQAPPPLVSPAQQL